MSEATKEEITEWMILFNVSDCESVSTIANIYIIESELKEVNLRKFRKLLKDSLIYDELLKLGYTDRSRRFTARQQQLVMMHLGKPKKALKELERTKRMLNKGRDLLL
ncbi:DUF4248 domain-containing protein [Bacteroides sedimenti]|uniref:Uncharacterized protein n=1 Tax=Bacteroides sedimenti TaxID=2136147 RepID=A0ABN6Z8H7_9BACE